MNWYAGRPTTGASTIVRNTYIFFKKTTDTGTKSQECTTRILPVHVFGPRYAAWRPATAPAGTDGGTHARDEVWRLGCRV